MRGRGDWAKGEGDSIDYGDTVVGAVILLRAQGLGAAVDISYLGQVNISHGQTDLTRSSLD